MFFVTLTSPQTIKAALSLRSTRIPPPQKPKNVQIVYNEFQPIPKPNQYTKSITIKNISYSDMACQNNSNSNTPAEAPFTDIKCMMEMLQTILQQVMTLTSLLVHPFQKLHRWLRSHKYLPVECKQAVTTHFWSQVFSQIKLHRYTPNSRNSLH